MKRIVIGGIVGGIVMFFWGFVAHTFLPLGKMGTSRFTSEEVMVTALASSAVESGLYFVPAEPEGSSRMMR
ncbi:MAG: hypothetical protein E2O39_00790 [Planctomycetota bacterium]|nr:MAG: hypothetical protein E2O39_00790 [Planctomycetota bacterium]